MKESLMAVNSHDIASVIKKQIEEFGGDLTQVDIGTEIKQIICGAENVRKGQFVVVVLIHFLFFFQEGFYNDDSLGIIIVD